ncbi:MULTISPECIES: nitroreductase family protein [Roseivirga]|jgi:nitroreductase|uniref:nitroreductase family protein n=1 Tax=Roseivirga TaxID=290180 RepID=UPI00257FEC6B|nr:MULTISPECIES: nitroreductase [Roseivirga]MEC7755314.1 nitroreductase [Bacteroidota bacterium]|tara:strand:+ start:58859 stop:59452 length:594 start_codon:yes stop_codon:yes gene_type:complete
MTKFDTQSVNDLIRSRRSIYPAQYSDEPVDDAIIKEMLENANWAPTHKLTEPWRFVVFKGEGLQKLATFQAELYERVSMARGTFNETTREKLATKPLLASHIIAIGMSRDAKEVLPLEEEISAVAMAVQNMYLTATAHGIGCYWGSGGITYYEEAKAFFGLEAKDRLLGFLYVGTVKEGFAPQGRRNPIEDKVSWVG